MRWPTPGYQLDEVAFNKNDREMQTGIQQLSIAAVVGPVLPGDAGTSNFAYSNLTPLDNDRFEKERLR